MRQSTSGPKYPVFQMALANGVPIAAGGSIAGTFDLAGDQREAFWIQRQNKAGYLNFGLWPTIQIAAYNPPPVDTTTFLVGITNITSGSITPSSNVLIDSMMIQDDNEA